MWSVWLYAVTLRYCYLTLSKLNPPYCIYLFCWHDHCTDAVVSLPTSGFVNVRLEEEKPIFNKQRIDFTPPEKINHLTVCNNQLCMSLGKDTLLRQITLSTLGTFWSLLCLGCFNFAFAAGFIVINTRSLLLNAAWWHVLCSVPHRIDLAKPDQLNQIELGRKDESKVHRLFLDPTGEKTTIMLAHLIYRHSVWHCYCVLICFMLFVV